MLVVIDDMRRRIRLLLFRVLLSPSVYHRFP